MMPKLLILRDGEWRGGPFYFLLFHVEQLSRLFRGTRPRFTASSLLKLATESRTIRARLCSPSSHPAGRPPQRSSEACPPPLAQSRARCRDDTILPALFPRKLFALKESP